MPTEDDTQDVVHPLEDEVVIHPFEVRRRLPRPPLGARAQSDQESLMDLSKASMANPTDTAVPPSEPVPSCHGRPSSKCQASSNVQRGADPQPMPSATTPSNWRCPIASRPAAEFRVYDNLVMLIASAPEPPSVEFDGQGRQRRLTSAVRDQWACSLRFLYLDACHHPGISLSGTSISRRTSEYATSLLNSSPSTAQLTSMSAQQALTMLVLTVMLCDSQIAC